MARAILIAGPTASGKSAIAAALAEKTGGVVVNADSMQVYADLAVLTARPTPQETATVPHRLYGHVDAARNYSVGRYLEDCAQALAEIAEAGRTPILVGGTGLYFKALTQGLSDIPRVPESLRAAVRTRWQGAAPAQMHAELSRRDPTTAARLQPTDPQRLLRALEVLEATGQPLSSFQNARTAPLLGANAWGGFFLAPDRAALRRAIDRRFLSMMEQGALDEAARLAARRLDPALPAMRAHGVPHLIAHLAGKLSLEEAIARSQSDTRAYAKRQFTFARHQLGAFEWVAPEDALRAIVPTL